jgi:ABC-type transport system involved in multi-copper enzyme maturation permease subunit
MRGIIKDTIAELLDRKVLYLFGFVTLVAMLIFHLINRAQLKLQIQTGGELGMGQLDNLVGNLTVQFFSGFVSFLVFLAVMAGAGVIPAMLEKGRADFYLSKPVSRRMLMTGKLFSVWVVYGLTVVICSILAYVVVALSSGVFSAGMFYQVGMAMVSLLIWLSIVALAGVLTNSTAMAVAAAFLVWVAHSIFDEHELIKGFLESRLLAHLVDFLYYVLPKTSAIGDIAVRLASDRSVGSWMPVWSSLLFALVMFYAAIWAFNRRDY